MAKLTPIVFGQLAASSINKALDLEIDEALVVMSPNAQRHARRRHPSDFARCFPHVASVINNPLYVRDDFRNQNKIELVGKPAGLGEHLLVAVEVALDPNGRYNVTSFYPISEKKVESRRDKKTLVRITLI